MNDKEIIRFYFDTMASNDQLMQWYRAFFLAFEAIIFAGVLAVHGRENVFSPWWIFILALIGLGISFAGVWACVQRGRIVDGQKRHIQVQFFNKDGSKRSTDDPLAECFELYSPKCRAEKHVPRIAFNYALHIIIGALLLLALWKWKPISSDCCLLYCVITIVYIVLIVLAITCFSWFGTREDLRQDLWDLWERKKRS